jgi:hypothetical protein
MCSGPLDTFLEETTRLIKRSSGGNHNPSKALHASGHKKAATGTGKPPKAGGVKKAQVREGAGATAFEPCSMPSATCQQRQPSSTVLGLLCAHQQQASHRIVLSSWFDGWLKAASHGCLQLPPC